MLGEVSENIAKITKCETRNNALRERMEDDFDFLRMESFSIPKKEGVWESFTTNRPSTDALKLINTLATARLKLWIPLTDENEKQRKHLSKTEQFPYGVFALRDSIYGTIPEILPLQASMSWNASMRGWLAILCYLYNEDDGKNGKVVPHIMVWDTLNTSWISGSKGLLWAAYKRYASQEEAKAQYGEDLAPDVNGRVKLYDVWDGDQEGVIGEGDWVKKPENQQLYQPR